MKETALYLNTPEPTPSLYGEASQLARAKPTTGEVVGAYTEEMFFGEASLSQDIEAGNIRKQERRGIALSQEDWKSSEEYREGLSWYEGITKESAGTLARLEDDRRERSIVMERASGLQTGLGMGTGFVAGIFEPKNLASGVTAALVTGGAGAAIPSLGRLIGTQTIKGAALRGAVEGTVAAGAVEYSNIESSKIVQGDYTLADSLLNFGLSSVLGAGIGAGAKALELRGIARGGAPRAYKPESAELAVKEYDTALAQIVEGKEVDVTAVKQLDNAEKVRKAQKELPALNKKIDEAQERTGLTPVTERPEFQRWFEGSKAVDDNGAPIVLYHGTDADFEGFSKSSLGGVTNVKSAEQGFFFVNRPDVASSYARHAAERGKVAKLIAQSEKLEKKGKFDEADELLVQAEELEEQINRLGGQGANVLPVYIDIKNPKEIDAKGGFFTDIEEGLTKQIEKAKQQGHDGVIIRNLDDDPGRDGVIGDHYVTFEPTQIKSIFNRGAFDLDDPRLIDIKKAEDLQVRKGQLESDSKLQIDQAPIQKLQNKVGSVDSSAYDDVIPEDIADDFRQSTIEDERALEQSLEAMQDEIQELLDQDLLNDAEIKTLERLAEIDNENAIFDNVLLNAKNCLLRG